MASRGAELRSRRLYGAAASSLDALGSGSDLARPIYASARRAHARQAVQPSPAQGFGNVTAEVATCYGVERVMERPFRSVRSRATLSGGAWRPAAIQR